jgi:hypothetical protein
MKEIQIETLIGLFDTAIGDMLKTITQFKLFMLAEQNSKTDMIAKLECTT